MLARSVRTSSTPYWTCWAREREEPAQLLATSRRLSGAAAVDMFWRNGSTSNALACTPICTKGSVTEGHRIAADWPYQTLMLSNEVNDVFGTRKLAEALFHVPCNRSYASRDIFTAAPVLSAHPPTAL